ncbi:type II toxin-antitoxin system RelE/ParE family toxin [Rhizobium leguminosarum]|uniref:type II toxin-antitoxin system RelE/ParE family toxin n=1 Tax=Rhizobium leguminosarum TaxID=384 RepID=UPI000490522E|nr:type II toxin-antitoxin system RelE/ParE family toxin [Rhizobium leguminosarum]NKL67143.1 type II toxin-antitoxin system RelE/ParE family toxin [Rhizobium leguminosarum bv. viciae]
MPASLVWLPQALADVREIYVQIGLEQPQAAERFFDSFERKARLLANQPRLGARRPEIRPSARVLVEAPFVMLYETVPDTDEGPVETVQIVRVIDGRRDLHSLVS